MRFDFVTLFPDLMRDAASHGVTGRAVEHGIVELRIWNPRDYAIDRYRTVDDRPYGGGPGMVMKVEPLRAAIRAARADSPAPAITICLSPQGKRLSQADAQRLAACNRLILVAGRYEGIDERLVETEVDEEISIGDYIISGGELAALVVFDAIVRLLPGVLGHAESAVRESHMHGLLDCPHYTRPPEFGGLRVPPILLSGDHAAIDRWRLAQALGRTWLRRPEMLDQLKLDPEQQRLLEEFKSDYCQNNLKQG